MEIHETMADLMSLNKPNLKGFSRLRRKWFYMLARTPENQKFVDVSVCANYYDDNNTPHASRKICAPWGVSFFMGFLNA